jgi:hypothetical protein
LAFPVVLVRTRNFAGCLLKATKCDHHGRYLSHCERFLKRERIGIYSASNRRFLFLDTCRSGNRYSQRLTNEAHEQNIVVYAAARWDQDALESSKLGGGLFTYALVEGVKGKAKDKAGEVRVESLRDNVLAQVKELAKPFGHDQEPQFVKGRDPENYLLTRGE